MVQNLRAYFILYVITIKCIKCMQGKIEVSCMLQRPRLISTKILGYLSLAAQRGSNTKKVLENSQGWQKGGILWPRGDICHPMAPHGYWPVVGCFVFIGFLCACFVTKYSKLYCVSFGYGSRREQRIAEEI